MTVIWLRPGAGRAPLNVFYDSDFVHRKLNISLLFITALIFFFFFTV